MVLSGQEQNESIQSMGWGDGLSTRRVVSMASEGALWAEPCSLRSVCQSPDLQHHSMWLCLEMEPLQRWLRLNKVIWVSPNSNDWCPYKKWRLGHGYTERVNQRRTQGEDGHLHAKEEQTCLHLDLRPLASWRSENSSLSFKPLVC